MTSVRVNGSGRHLRPGRRPRAGRHPAPGRRPWPAADRRRAVRRHPVEQGRRRLHRLDPHRRTARWPSASRRSPGGGSRATTTRRTRPPSTSPCRCRTASRCSATASCRAPPLPETTGWTRWSWRSTKPMATYLAFLAIGQYDIVTDTAPNGQPVINAYSTLLPQDYADAAKASIERTAEVVDWESGIFGPYPFEAQGGVAAPPDGLGFALETQTRPVYALRLLPPRRQHVRSSSTRTPTSGSATRCRWPSGRTSGSTRASPLRGVVVVGGPEARARRRRCSTSPTPATRPTARSGRDLPGDPGAAKVFDGAVYNRGAMTLHQLRLAVGDDAFFEILPHLDRRPPVRQRQHRPVPVALAEKVSGQAARRPVPTWLFTPGRPALGAATVAAKAAQPKSWTKLREARHLTHQR